MGPELNGSFDGAGARGESIDEDGLVLDVAVIGAGIAGLTAAIALRRAGHKVTVSGWLSLITEGQG